MPEKIRKSHSHSLQKSSRRNDRDLEVEDRSDRVTFMSTNKKDSTKFVGSAPPGSRLAATLAQIAATVQSDNLPEMSPAYTGGSGQGLLPSNAVPRGQIQDAAPRDRGFDRGSGGGNGFVEDVEDVEYVPSSAHVSGTKRSRRVEEAPPVARRLETDAKIEYHTKGPNGELYVSAPTGSNEAQLFDEVARRLTKSNVSIWHER